MNVRRLFTLLLLVVAGCSSQPAPTRADQENWQKPGVAGTSDQPGQRAPR